ncbi:hypothetical protein ABPG75_005019 [Micractinium tetrahymenae]
MRAPVLYVAVLLLVAASGALAARCPTDCDKCNTKGQCLKCNDGYALTPKGKCIACKVPGPLGDFCTNCDGNTKYCRACYNWEGEGTGVYAKNGRCERCPDPNCEECHNGSGKCRTCFRGMAISKKTGKCTNCADKNCITCDSSLKKCSWCYSGFAPNASGRCVPCGVANCHSCSAPGKCESCELHYVLMGSKCQKCKVAGCDECKPGNPNVCEMCEGAVDPVNGKCPKA